MRRVLLAILVSGAVLLSAAAPAGASQVAGPCNDSDGDGRPSGREYAAHHISTFARAGRLGNEGHKPGDHRGFSLCLGVHD